MILLIDNYDSFTHNLYQVLMQFTSDVQVVRNDQITLEEVAKLSPEAIVLSPGPGRPESAGICIELIREFSHRIPILGVCLGLQAIAVAFGANVIAAEQIMHGKTSTIQHNNSNLYSSIPNKFNVARYHSLMVDSNSLPSELNIESQTNSGVLMGLKHKDHLTYGVQFHPESILSEHGTTLIENFLNLAKGRGAC